MAPPSPDKSAVPGSAVPLPDGSSSCPNGFQGREQQVGLEVAETDVWWGAYASRTMLPGFLVCLMLTVALLAMDWVLESRNSRSDLISSAILGLAGALWLFEGTRWLYRMIAINYRLTNRRLLLTLGFKLSDTSAIELPRVTEVVVTQSSIDRLLGVGRIFIHVHDDLRPLLLEGVLSPERVARTIRRRARQARALPHAAPEIKGTTTDS
jgi:hypothetical protein